MKIEYRFLDDCAHNKEIEAITEELKNYNLSKVSVLQQYDKVFKKKLPENFKLSSIIDFPFGSCDNETRINMVQNSIKTGCSSIEIVLPFHLLANSMFTAIKKDAENIFAVCEENKVDLSYILEYRSFNYSVLYRACKLLLRHKIKNVYISTGYKIDDIYDHLIAIAMIQKNVPDINITCSANIFTEKHMELLYLSDIRSLCLSSVPAVEIASKFVSNL